MTVKYAEVGWGCATNGVIVAVSGDFQCACASSDYPYMDSDGKKCVAEGSCTPLSFTDQSGNQQQTTYYTDDYTDDSRPEMMCVPATSCHRGSIGNDMPT